jgi:hypothetical protein
MTGLAVVMSIAAAGEILKSRSEKLQPQKAALQHLDLRE